MLVYKIGKAKKQQIATNNLEDFVKNEIIVIICRAKRPVDS